MNKVVHTIELKNGLEIGDDFVEQLEFREPTVAQLLSADNAQSGSYAEEVELLSALCGVARIHLEKLGLEDFARCREVVQAVSLMMDHALSWDEAQAMLEEAKRQLGLQQRGGMEGAEPGKPQPTLGLQIGEGEQSI